MRRVYRCQAVKVCVTCHGPRTIRKMVPEAGVDRAERQRPVVVAGGVGTRVRGGIRPPADSGAGRREVGWEGDGVDEIQVARPGGVLDPRRSVGKGPASP